MAAFALRPDSVRANSVSRLADSNRDRPAPRVLAGTHSLAAAYASMHKEIAA